MLLPRPRSSSGEMQAPLGCRVCLGAGDGARRHCHRDRDSQGHKGHAQDLPAELACRQRGSIGGNDAVQCPLGRSLQWRPATYPRGPRLSRTPTGGYALCLGIQVYTGFSSCRFTSDLREAKTDGLVASTPYFKSVTNYLTNPDMTPILKHLVTVSSLPLKAVETQFAADSSGFTTSRSWSKPRETSIWSESQPIRHI